MLARFAKRYVSVAFSLLMASAPLRGQDGEYLFKTYCAICHEATGEERAPGRDVLKQMTPEHILQALEKGSMKTQAAERSRVQRRILAEYLSGKRFGSEPVDLIPRSAFCSKSTDPFPSTIVGPAWNGWGVTITNTRFQPDDAAELSAVDVPRLKLKWAFGFPGATSGGTQPVVVDGRVYVGTAEGDVYALDAKSGCVYWRFESEAAVRSAISVGKAPNGRLAGYFGDQSANMYAVDLETGKLLWKKKVDDYWRSAITGAPTLHAGRLYVPVSSREESQVGDPRYPCCKFRGSVVAMDAANGKVLWKTYMIPDEARMTVKNSVGTQLWGPSGGAVWNAPTIDLKRSALYIGTGNNYSTPATNASDAIVSLDLKSGKIRWVHQVKENDVWNASCGRPDREPAVCPDADAPDVDFAASPSLVDLKNGRQIIIAGNKSGMVFALDPDAQGKTVWQQHVGGSRARRNSVGSCSGRRSCLCGYQRVQQIESRCERRNRGPRPQQRKHAVDNGASFVWTKNALQTSPVGGCNGDPGRRVFGHHGRSTAGIFDSRRQNHLGVQHSSGISDCEWR